MDSPSREPSPDWLRTFQTPLKEFKPLSSSSLSDSSLDKSQKKKPKREAFEIEHNDTDEEIVSAQRCRKSTTKTKSNKVMEVDLDNDESGEDEKVFSTRVKPKIAKADQISADKDELQNDGDDMIEAAAPLEPTPKTEDAAVQEEDVGEGQERRVKRALSTLPLVFGDKVHRSKILLECEGDALDVSGDIGAVGRVTVPSNSDDDFLLDLKGVIYKGTIVPSNTFFVVNIGQTEAKVEAIMSDFVQLQPSTNIFETETMVEGTLEGFGFDSDDDYMPEANANTTPAKATNDNKDEKKPAKQKPKALKPVKSTFKKSGKPKALKGSTKGGGSRKSAKKSSTNKRSGK